MKKKPSKHLFWPKDASSWSTDAKGWGEPLKKKPKVQVWYKGDILESRYGYIVFVVEQDGELVGRLLCDFGDSCENIPYSLDTEHQLIHRTTKPSKRREADK